MTFAEKRKSIGKQTEQFETPDAENIVELNGIKSGIAIRAFMEGHYGRV